ncbi:MAG: energy transducer TonB [Chitinophagaceae bacterium]|nr:energy transducer TonB [Chitinophagaceae bacterium]
MKIIFTQVFIIAAFTLNAQDSSSCYFDAQLVPTEKRNAVYTGKMVETGNGWEAFAFYPDGKPLMKGSYKDKKLRVRQGSYTVFYPNGKPKLSVSFDNNTIDGDYTSWHENGLLEDSGLIKENIKTGLWKKWYSTGIQESEGVYEDGAAEGTWKWYHPNGKPATIEVYSNQKLKDLTCFDTLGNQTGFSCRIDKKPCPVNAYSFESYVIENLIYPQAALKKGIEGNVAFEFFITSEGRLTRINFTNESHPMLRDEIVKFLKAIPSWEPAISHNRAVDCLYSYEVPFNLP